MPLYEYKCAKCGDVFELIQKFSDEPLSEHPGCGGAVERLLSPPALQFKGSGWYVTDYGRNGSDGKKKSKSESSDSAKTGVGTLQRHEARLVAESPASARWARGTGTCRPNPPAARRFVFERLAVKRTLYFFRSPRYN